MKIAQTVRYVQLFKRPATANRPSYKSGGKPMSHNGGRIHWSKGKGTFRVYKRSCDKIEENVWPVAGGANDTKLKFQVSCAMIEADERAVS